MNRQERLLLGRVGGCLDRMARLQPSNPMDVKAIARAANSGPTAARWLAMSLPELAVGDYEVASDLIGDAERELER